MCLYFYYGKKYEPKSGTPVLDQFISLWNPATDYDRDLIKAALSTPFWGGKAGRRPAIIIEADGEDDGRGVGKTELADSLHTLAGGQHIGPLDHLLDQLRCFRDGVYSC